MGAWKIKNAHELLILSAKEILQIYHGNMYFIVIKEH